MSWDKPSAGGDRPDKPHENGDGLPDPPRQAWKMTDAERRDFAEKYQKAQDSKNGERPSPDAPLDRPAAHPVDPVPDWDEIRERRQAISDSREYEQASKSGFWDSDEWKNRNSGEQVDRPLPGSRAESFREAEQQPKNAEGGSDADHARDTGKDSNEAEERVKPAEALKADHEGTAETGGEASEGTEQEEATPEASDQPSEADTPEPTDQVPDKNAEQVERLRERLERKDEIIDAKDRRIEKLEDRNDQLAEENRQLRERLDGKEHAPEIQETDETDPVAESSKTVNASDRDERQPDTDTPWYKKVPSEVKVGAGVAGATGAEAAMVVGHVMTTGEGSLATAAVGIGAAVLAILRERNKDKGDNPK